MCLVLNQPATDRFRAEKQGVITCYKVFEGDGETLLSPYIKTAYRAGETSAVGTDGPVKIELSDKEKESTQVVAGVHVMLTEDAAKRICEETSGETVVPVQCDVADLRAVGGFDSSGDDCAVFTKISIGPEAYNKALSETVCTESYADDDDDWDDGDEWGDEWGDDDDDDDDDDD